MVSSESRKKIREEREERREKSAERSEKREDDWGSSTLPLRERDPSMAEAAVQHGQPAVPVNGNNTGWKTTTSRHGLRTRRG